MYKLCIIIVGIFALLLYSCKGKVDCSTFKTGKFYFYSKRNHAKILISRSDSLQTQIDTKDWFVILHRVTWKTPCEYEMQRILPTTKTLPDSNGKFYSGLSTKIKIVESNENFYVCIVGEPAPPLFPEVRDTIWVDQQ